MLKVTLELLPQGDEGAKQLLGTCYIINDGTGTAEAGNYRATVYHTSNVLHKRHDDYTVRVFKHTRAQSPWKLVRKVLKEAFHND